VPFAGVDQKHLARSNVTRLRAVIEMQAPVCDDERDWDGVAVLGHGLARFETQAHHAHRPAIRDLLEPEWTGLLTDAWVWHVNIIHATGIEGARHARGTVVVIDVLRSFTVSAYALAGGARECRLVRTVDEARALAASTPGAVICAEEEGLPVEGIAISNSPTKISELDLTGRVLIQRSSAGTQVAAEVKSDDIFAASLVVVTATVQACLLTKPETLTLIASADHPEDHACAHYMEEVIRGRKPDLERLLRPLRETDRYQKVSRGEWPGFPPTDLDLALTADRFDFAMPVTKETGYLRLSRATRKT
jgi:2-phosphosulfolactate phosphatase